MRRAVAAAPLAPTADLAGLATAFARHRRPCVVTIGTFDGVHAGHRHLVQTASSVARMRQLATIAVTFSPRPDELFHGAQALPDLCTLAEREQRLLAAGADDVVILPFTRELASLRAEQFVEHLVYDLGMRALCVGMDFALGQGRAGDITALRELGVEVIVPNFIRDAEGAKLSSSLMRAEARAS